MNWSNLDHAIFWPHEHVGWNQLEGETLVESQAASVLHQKRLTGGQTALETPSPHILPNYCSDWPGVRRWERNQTLNFSLWLSFFKLYVSISVTFHVNSVPHYENAPDETVWKSAPLSTYLNDISISYKSMKAGFSLVPVVQQHVVMNLFKTGTWSWNFVLLNYVAQKQFIVQIRVYVCIAWSKTGQCRPKLVPATAEIQCWTR